MDPPLPYQPIQYQWTRSLSVANKFPHYLVDIIIPTVLITCFWMSSRCSSCCCRISSITCNLRLFYRLINVQFVHHNHNDTNNEYYISDAASISQLDCRVGFVVFSYWCNVLYLRTTEIFKINYKPASLRYPCPAPPAPICRSISGMNILFSLSSVNIPTLLAINHHFVGTYQRANMIFLMRSRFWHGIYILFFDENRKQH